MSVELRKKSSSFSQSTNPLKTVNKNLSKDNQLATCRSVSAFADTVHHNIKNQTNRKKQTQKFCIENPRHYSGKKHFEDSKPNQKGSSFVGYKQAIENRKKKTVIVKKNYIDELLSTVDAFQETLSSLPLEKLILSGSPFYWIEEQIKTFEKLHSKFTKIQPSLQKQTKQYYELKFQSAANLIKNIKHNLDSLNMMNLLKNYSSGGTSIQSRNSQSTSSLGHTQNFAFATKDLQQCQSRCNTENGDKINSGQKYASDLLKSSRFSSRNQSDKENISRQSNLPDKNSHQQKSSHFHKRHFEKVQINERDHFILNQYKSLNSQSQSFVDNIKTLRSEKSFSEQGDHCLRQTEKQKISQLMSKEPYNQNYCQQNASFFKKKNMNKTVSKYQKNPFEEGISTVQNLAHFISNESKQTFNTIENDTYHESIHEGDQTKRKNILHTNSNFISLQEQTKALRKQLQTKNHQIESVESKYEKAMKVIRDQFAKKQKHYLETIYDLKEQNKDKQSSIKHLLLQAQQISDQLGFAKNSVKESSQINKKLKEKLTLLQQSAQTLSNQLRKYKIRQDELRETVQLQRQRTKKLQKENQEIQVHLQETKASLRLISQQKTSILLQNQKIADQLSALTQQREKMREKEQIYRLKYFRLYADYDRFKQKVNEDSEYWKRICLCCKKEYKNPQNPDPEKQTELRQLINFHKRRLLSSD